MIPDRDSQMGTRVAIEVTETAVRARTEAGVRDAGRSDVRSAVAALDDDVALLPHRVVPSRALWAALFESLITDKNAPVRLDSMQLIHPTTWSPGRLTLMSNAGRMMAATLTMRSRALALAERGVRTDMSGRAYVVVEVSPNEVAVAIVGHGSDGEPVAAVRHLEERSWENKSVADVARAVARAVEEIVRNERPGVAAILVDSADKEVGEAIVEAVDRIGLTPGVSQVAADAAFREVNQAPRVSSFLDESADEPEHPDVHRAPEWTPAARVGAVPRLPRWWPAAAIGLAAAIVVTGVVLTVASTRERRPSPTPPATATSLLVEGRVQLMVPAEWAVRRIPAGGAGSARVEVISPQHPEATVHVTQVRVKSTETLASTAETLRAAMAKEPPGIFTDFTMDDSKMGRPAVTYIEIREGHDIAWTVLLDHDLRIGVGCQFKKDSYQYVESACELAIRTTRAVQSGN
ncbi:type VII secretion-associated protein [Mycobacterium sp. CBMA271]|uniref:type VII secretion-associated protein n=1 Tax=unclassified Mycobacteroides TaxID=2618759 RepID=UPI00132213CD|nr:MULTISPECIES: type VII secretion-associated protein [unclassified Mycobacteroides]MUM18170.1 type VII secretion-associated protein [Mycobacteroides sp. CBMA 326]MUM20756.1 type VII secretion-associated protein [Mycobacteroides sp. CBMA 271]